MPGLSPLFDPPARITLAEWQHRYPLLKQAGMMEPSFGGPLERHLAAGDTRLKQLRFDNSPAALALWNFLLTEEERLHEARQRGYKIVGTMKDLGTIPVLAYSLPKVTAFYPDGAWWAPCILECGDGLLAAADRLGINDRFCPVRAMLGAFVTGTQFPRPDLLICSTGAICDDFSTIAQRLEGLGYPIFWWEVPFRRLPEADEPAVTLPSGERVPAMLVNFVRQELERVRKALEDCVGQPLTEEMLRAGIQEANAVRTLLQQLRQRVFTAESAPLPALELLICEALAIHYCSDRAKCLCILKAINAEVERRVPAKQGVLPSKQARIFWVNPVADLRVMNLLEDCGGRLCGCDFMFGHAIETIPEDLSPMKALARMVLSDPMVGSATERAARVVREAQAWGAEAVVISRIPGASHCALEGRTIAQKVQSELHLPVLEIEVPPVCDAMLPTLRTRLEALIETVRERAA